MTRDSCISICERISKICALSTFYLIDALCVSLSTCHDEIHEPIESTNILFIICILCNKCIIYNIAALIGSTSFISLWRAIEFVSLYDGDNSKSRMLTNESFGLFAASDDKYTQPNGYCSLFFLHIWPENGTIYDIDWIEFQRNNRINTVTWTWTKRYT